MGQSTIARAGAFGGFDILESRVGRFGFSPHRHAEVVIAAYGAGRKNASCDRKSFALQRDDMLLIGPEVLHEGHTPEGCGWHYLSVYLTLEQITQATGLSRPQVETAVAGYRTSQRTGAMETLREAAQEPLHLSDLLVDLLARPSAGTAPRRPGAGVAKVHQCLADDPAQMASLPELARVADISPEHLSRQFRAAFGQSPFQFLTMHRARLAHRYLSTGLPPAEAAHLAGFADQSHLNRWFKRIYGITPGALAASYRASIAFKTAGRARRISSEDSSVPEYPHADPSASHENHRPSRRQLEYRHDGVLPLPQ